MQEKQHNNRTVYRLPPCPAYDVEGMESWLEAMAANGYHLAYDGMFAGIAAFEQGEPAAVRYRLDAALKSTSMWAPDGGEPDPESVELGAAAGWQYTARRGQFYIYRTSQPGAHELNTDPQVQALALKAVRQRQQSALFVLLFWMIIYPLLQLRYGLLLMTINVGFWLILFGFFVYWGVILPRVIELAHLNRLRKKLQIQGYLEHAADRRQHTVRYYSIKFLLTLLVIVWIGLLLHALYVDTMDENRTPLAAYPGQPPFATLLELAGPWADEGSYRTTFGDDLRFDSYRQWQDPLAPNNIAWREHARITRADGTLLDGGLYVYYHEVATPWLARWLAWEYMHRDQRREYTPLEITVPGVDEAEAYMNELHFPTVVLRKGCKVMRVLFYQTSASYTLPLEEWALWMAQALA